jgi:hypothetical protein
MDHQQWRESWTDGDTGEGREEIIRSVMMAPSQPVQVTANFSYFLIFIIHHQELARMVLMPLWMVIRVLSLVKMGPSLTSQSVSVKMEQSWWIGGIGSIGSRRFLTGSRTSLGRKQCNLIIIIYWLKTIQS